MVSEHGNTPPEDESNRFDFRSLGLPENFAEEVEKLCATPHLVNEADKVFENLDGEAEVRYEEELESPIDSLSKESELGAIAAWDEDPIPAIDEDDIWDFQEEFDGRPVRPIYGGEKDMITRSFNNAHSSAFQYNSRHSKPLENSTGVKLELTYPLSNGDEIRTTLERVGNTEDLENPRLSATIRRWSDGQVHEGSVYILNNQSSLLFRTDNPFGEHEERIEGIISKDSNDITEEEIIEVHRLASESVQRIEMERQLCLNNRPIGLHEAITMSEIIRQSKPLNHSPEAE